ncbi:FUSC family protein [Clostridium sporogenes]|uniref:FUSC family protein n=1 Tax=Clostridium sporogenes TaxID=1509 RepID=UPI0013D678DA|nr:FUSC family protein [Clostridium sporogenes]NFF65897.1 FUSC family protein [Clostridium sporogenes]NFF98286.1 FUSC family protein [Clostridium sporogenes]NFG05364.1 FUSC family protein [Clostridium sporogenes]NFG50965.1 FUSC family protein [Clostridium sporogenes]NFP83203.1 FUSC family protein [Clostridium sporogenes]
MNKKLLVSKTALFVFIILFIVAFQKIFGIENTLIGVTVITAALMLLERDFTLSPFKYLIYIIGINLFLGIAAFVASKNLWIGIPVNFITIFGIGFLLCYDLKSNMYIPFGLQYLFMLSVPVDGKDLGVRLLSLVFGALFIMIMQVICNKNRLIKSSNKIIEKSFENLLKKIQLLIEEKDVTNIDKCIKKDIGELKKLIYNKRKNFFYLTEGGRIKVNIVATLECINTIISDLDKEFNKDDITKILNDVYNKIYKISQNKNDIHLLQRIKNEESNICVSRIVNNIDILCNCFVELNNLDEHNCINKNVPIPSEFNFINIMKRNFTINTLKFSYAFKLAVGVTVSIFIMDYFKVYEGRWMAYTVFSLVQPYAEQSKIKSEQRVKGTLIGGIIFIILFSIVKDSTIRSLIVMGAGYVDGYNTRYDRKIICVTISALGVASITSSIGGVLFFRILFVGLGVGLALLVNKFICPYSLNDANRDLISMSNSIIEQLIKEVKLYNLRRNNNHSIENLFIISSFIENKLIINKSKEYKDYIKNKKKVIDNIYEMYIWVQNDKISRKDFKNIII